MPGIIKLRHVCKNVFFVVLEFEKYVVPEDVVRLGHLALPGLAFPQTPYPPKEDLEVLETQFLSPIKNAQHPGTTCVKYTCL